MFKALVISKKHPLQIVSLGVVFLSLTIHLSIMGFMLLNDYLVVPDTRSPAVNVSFFSALPFNPLPPPEPAPAPQDPDQSQSGTKKPDPLPEKPDTFELLPPTEVPPDIEIGDIDEKIEEIARNNNDVGMEVDHSLGIGVPGGVPGGSGNAPGGTGGVGSDTDYRDINAGMVKPKKLFGPNPVYPELAKKAGVSCVVIVRAKININGEVDDLEFLRSAPVFQEQFEEAVRDAVVYWKFSPATVNGIPVPVRYVLTIQFSLHSSALNRSALFT